MPVFNNILAGSSGQSTGYDIDQSLRIEQGDSAFLSKAFAGSGNRKTWTFSFWIKRSLLSNDEPIFTCDIGASTGILEFGASNKMAFYDLTPSPGTYQTLISTNRLFRDASAWYHIVFRYDTTDSTEANRVKIYVNGELASLDSTTYPSLNYDGNINFGNGSALHGLGKNIWSSAFSSFYLAEVHFIDGTALDASSFGETDEDTNQWQAVEYAGSYGTNGFYLKFQDSSALGDDSSGNTNDFTSTNLVATDQMIDTPTNNYCTMNPLDTFHAASSTFSEGNLKVSEVGGDSKYTQVGNFGMSSGKWYFEFCGVNSDNSWMLGIADVTKGLSRGYTGTAGDGLYVYVDGDTYAPTSSASYGVSWTYGDVMGVAVDMDNNALYFAKDNTWMNSGDPTSGASKTGAAFTTELANKIWVAAMGRGSVSNTITATFNFGQDSSFAGAETAQGNGGTGEDFYYTPPAGFKALNSDNLPDPAIALPTDHFDTVLYTGGASFSKIETGFAPDLNWIKARSTTYPHILSDSVRGVGKYLQANDTAAEVTDANFVTSFDSDGVSIGQTSFINADAITFAAWNWKGGGTAVSNTDGSITSSVSANTTAGFSIVGWLGTGTGTPTVGHGLSVAPNLIITKQIDGTSPENWASYSTPTGPDGYINLDQTNAWSANAAFFNDAPTASVFTPGSHVYVNPAANMIAYCFNSIEGYSKVGSYTGNGNNDGTFIYTGFRPALFITKRFDQADDWWLEDNKRNTYNPQSKLLYANATNAEATEANKDFVSNGVKLRLNNENWNANGGTYIYLAFAKSPFKTSNAR